MLTFRPALAPDVDFVLANSPLDPTKLNGFTLKPLNGSTLILAIGCGLAENPNPSIHLFSGFCARNRRVVSGADAFTLDWTDRHPGNYAIVEEHDRELSVRSDIFGLQAIYLYRSATNQLASNNLHMLVSVCRQLGIRLTPYKPFFERRLLPRWIGQQASGRVCAFSEITLLLTDEELRGSRSTGFRIIRSPRQPFTRYADALEASIEAITNQVAAAANTFHCLVYRLSGGYDSRAVFGALIRLDLLKRAYCWTFPHLADDFRSVQMLVEQYGGEFCSDFPFGRAVVPLTIEDAFNQWASNNFGSYSTLLGFEKHARASFDDRTVAVLFGGGGECYRDFYFADVDIEREHKFRKRIAAIVSGDTPSLRGSAHRIAESYCEELNALPGASVREKLRAHYLNYRNRFHFGGGTSSKMNRISMSPLMQVGLLDAAEISRREGRDLRRILADIYEAFHPDLMKIPFDRPEKAMVPQSLQWPGKAYDPVSITSAKPPALFDSKRKSALIEEKFKEAVTGIKEIGIYDDFDFDGYVADIINRGQVKPAVMPEYQASVISTYHLLQYAS
ncbi:hypothetical protein Rumeso_02706 [Rubellimicrobium mesophilum DSM 19309]|uniref:Asparagine synthetase domain-containing protein n=1 Tax=Rubellimicrobium mesophilum DSM 19309 TaxID=442562 RepID=A0A017HPD9_9RHOB|nr:hypothetical protein [Rubellimicrobium mesophilum]EYD75619.1 hypothetical protein Rumeso_02706 [Rubellimicrobium mesophilum DSM 19309]